jgi:hypothetical protein
MGKKIGNIMLSLLVLCTTTGIVVNQHYSNGELYSASLYGSAESCCPIDSENHDTCQETTKVYKVKDYFQPSNPGNTHLQFTSTIQLISLTVQTNTCKSVISSITNCNPFKTNISRPELLQVFIL